MADPFGFLSFLRAVNVALSLVAVAMLYVRLVDTWAHLSRGIKIARAGIVLFAVAAAVGSGVKYVLHTPTDWSIFLVTAACLLVDVGMWLSRHDPNKHI